MSGYLKVQPLARLDYWSSFKITVHTICIVLFASDHDLPADFFVPLDGQKNPPTLLGGADLGALHQG